MGHSVIQRTKVNLAVVDQFLLIISQSMDPIARKLFHLQLCITFKKIIVKILKFDCR